MKILYISPENTVGTLTLWKKEHEKRGNECRTITFFQSPKNFEDDICLNLPFNFTRPAMANIRNKIYQFYRGGSGYFREKKGYPPVWKPEGFLDRSFFKIKDLLWMPIVYKAIKKYKEIKIVSICDLDIDKAKKYANKEISIYKNYHQMLLENNNINCVAIMTPSGMHFNHAYEIIKKYKKNVIIEKPVVLRIDQLKKLYILAKKKKM